MTEEDEGGYSVAALAQINLRAVLSKDESVTQASVPVQTNHFMEMLGPADALQCLTTDRGRMILLAWTGTESRAFEFSGNRLERLDVKTDAVLPPNVVRLLPKSP